eukprot:GGOE01057056.1.p1 GENE.GGOE01057056.1~~GGOE01057056.1.p1  ORF type:complete len:563 (+),score=130.44 GGOE01057056.1:81-1769(+)
MMRDPPLCLPLAVRDPFAGSTHVCFPFPVGVVLVIALFLPQGANAPQPFSISLDNHISKMTQALQVGMPMRSIIPDLARTTAAASSILNRTSMPSAREQHHPSRRQWGQVSFVLVSLGIAVVACASQSADSSCHERLSLKPATSKLSGDELGSVDEVQERKIGVSLRPEVSVMGAAFLVAGTMVGAGILALPAQTGPAGFGLSTLVLAFCWLFMTASGLLIAEVNLATCQAMARESVSIETMAEFTLGHHGSVFVSLCYLLLHYALLVAYFVKAGTVLRTLTDGACPASLSSVGFATALGLVVYASTPKGLDLTNRGLTVVLGLSYITLVAIGASQIHVGNLARNRLAEVPRVVPILLLSLVYQNIIPTICSQLMGDMPSIRKAILYGTATPTAGCILWNAVALGRVPYEAGVDPLDVMSSEGNEVLQIAVQMFALSAVSTSAIGFVLGLVDLFDDSLGKRLVLPRSAVRPYAFILTVIPPLVLALSYPQVFFDALQFAGIYGVCTVFGLVPPLMAWKSRTVMPKLDRPLLPGGKPILAAMVAFASLVILDDVATRLGAHRR